MTDKELLEYAAKAAGIDLIPMVTKNVKFKGDDIFNGFMTNCDQWPKGWFNPRSDDGDAFRLLVALRLTVCVRFHEVEVFDEHGEFLVSVPFDEDDDRNAETRLAIFRAAAEIGKSMP